MALKGKAAEISVSDNDTNYDVVGELNEASVSIEGSNEEITVFGDHFIKRLQTLKDGSWDLSGFYDPTDTDGQVFMLNRLLDNLNNDLFIRILYDGTHGFKQPVLIASFDVDATADGVVELSITFEGNGKAEVVE